MNDKVLCCGKIFISLLGLFELTSRELFFGGEKGSNGGFGEEMEINEHDLRMQFISETKNCNLIAI